MKHKKKIGQQDMEPEGTLNKVSSEKSSLNNRELSL